MKKLIVITLCFLSLLLTESFAANSYPDLWKAYPLYVSAELGYGSTDWSMLEDHCDEESGSQQGQCVTTVGQSAPKSAGDDGIVWGWTAGYEVQPYFALELNYSRYPTTTVTLEESNVYAYTNPNAFESSTYAYAGLAKFMVQIAQTAFRGYANAGIAVTHRYDSLADTARITGTFGTGVNYTFLTHWMAELGFQYYAGYDQASLYPVKDYIPFLYSITLKLGYRFRF